MLWRVECPKCAFSVSVIDGVFSAERCPRRDDADQRGWHFDVRYAPVVQHGPQANDIGAHTTTDRDDGRHPPRNPTVSACSHTSTAASMDFVDSVQGIATTFE